jgi:hypothetical protein
MNEQIYVYLKNEGVDCWRPVNAIREGKYYRIITIRDKEDEEWEFDTGKLVECKIKKLDDGKEGLVAIKEIII